MIKDFLNNGLTFYQVQHLTVQASSQSKIQKSVQTSQHRRLSLSEG